MLGASRAAAEQLELRALSSTGWAPAGRHTRRLAVLAIAAVLIVGCELATPEAGTDSAPVGGRVLVIPVVNDSALPALLLVAEDRQPVGRAVGVASPPVVPPGATIEVRFHVPDSQTWAIFVNAGPDIGPLLLASDLRRCIGRVPIQIGVGRDGGPFWSTGREPSCVST
jgi:hypothetical protein